jgi:hypothetical protein
MAWMDPRSRLLAKHVEHGGGHPDGGDPPCAYPAPLHEPLEGWADRLAEQSAWGTALGAVLVLGHQVAVQEKDVNVRQPHPRQTAV